MQRMVVYPVSIRLMGFRSFYEACKLRSKKNRFICRCLGIYNDIRTTLRNYLLWLAEFFENQLDGQVDCEVVD